MRLFMRNSLDSVVGILGRKAGEEVKVQPDQLFAYASGFADRAEAAGQGTAWPTVRDVKRRFPGVTYADIEDAISLYDGGGYMGLATGVGIAGAGQARLRNESQHQVEAYL